LVAYILMALAGAFARSHERCALFAVGAAALLLLFTGIHNAWDLVTHIVFMRRHLEQEKPEEKK
jgi:hypothetical protein